MDFLKKHYEKIVLCVVLLGLAATVFLMQSGVEKAKGEVSEINLSGPGGGGGGGRGAPKKPVAPVVDLTPYTKALEQVTNPPPVVLSGEHNLFNPVTWKRNPNGTLFKVLTTGAGALAVTNIIPVYTVISFEHFEGKVFTMTVQTNVDFTKQPLPRPTRLHLELNERRSNYLFSIIGTKGPENDPTDVNLEITKTEDTNVWVSAAKPYKQVTSYLADLKYDPDPSLSLNRKKIDDKLRLDGEPYIIVEITSDAVRVRSERTTQVTEIKWIKSP